MTNEHDALAAAWTEFMAPFSEESRRLEDGGPSGDFEAGWAAAKADIATEIAMLEQGIAEIRSIEINRIVGEQSERDALRTALAETAGALETAEEWLNAIATTIEVDGDPKTKDNGTKDRLNGVVAHLYALAAQGRSGARAALSRPEVVEVLRNACEHDWRSVTYPDAYRDADYLSCSKCGKEKANGNG